MSDLSSAEIVARVDVYDDESLWQQGKADRRVTFVLDHVTHVGSTKSRTRPFAFEICERDSPVLEMSGATDIESFSWMLTLQLIFTPNEVKVMKGSYSVDVYPSSDATRSGLSGTNTMTVTSSSISLTDSHGHPVVSWGLSTLLRFTMDKTPDTGAKSLLVIQCGPNSSTGESVFKFISSDVPEILNNIRRCICMCLAKSQDFTPRPHSKSVSSIGSVGERNIQKIIDGHTASVERSFSRDRSDSDTSRSAVDQRLSPSSRKGSMSNDQGSHSSSGTSSELDVLHEMDTSKTKDLEGKRKGSLKGNNNGIVIKSENAQNESDYYAIKETTKYVKPETRYAEPSQCIPTISISAPEDEPPPVVPRRSTMLVNHQVTSSAASTDLYKMHRSNSFPDDLNSFRKRLDSLDINTENIYEELSELRNSRRGSNISLEGLQDAPPELPARPDSLVIPEKQGEMQFLTVKKLTSFLPKFRASTFCEIPSNLSNKPKGYNEDDRNNIQSSDKAMSKTSSMEDIVENSYSSVSGVYTSIQEVNNRITKRRRSSDITPVSSQRSSMLLDVQPQDSDDTTSIILPTNEEKKTITSQEHLIDLNDPPSTQLDTNTNKDEPLIDFFLDDKSVKNNPMIKRKISTTVQPTIESGLVIPTSFSYNNNPIASQNIPTTVRAPFHSNLLSPTFLDVTNNNSPSASLLQVSSTQNAHNLENVSLMSQSSSYSQMPVSPVSQTTMEYNGMVITNNLAQNPRYSRGMSHPAAFPNNNNGTHPAVLAQLSTSAPMHTPSGIQWPTLAHDNLYMPMQSNVSQPQSLLQSISENNKLAKYPNFNSNQNQNNSMATGNDNVYIQSNNKDFSSHFLL